MTRSGRPEDEGLARFQIVSIDVILSRVRSTRIEGRTRMPCFDSAVPAGSAGRKGFGSMREEWTRSR